MSAVAVAVAAADAGVIVIMLSSAAVVSGLGAIGSPLGVEDGGLHVFGLFYEGGNVPPDKHDYRLPSTNLPF